MNIEAWQTQQKAQKEDERKRKIAAQDALKGYRGGINEGDAKLAALREEERKQREEAEAQLRGYRGTLSDTDKKLLAQREAERQKRQAEEQRLRALGGKENIEAADAIAAVSVSAMAGKLNGEYHFDHTLGINHLYLTRHQHLTSKYYRSWRRNDSRIVWVDGPCWPGCPSEWNCTGINFRGG
jgi:hypothetical protein